MICVENCTCILCRELPGCETNIGGEKYSSVNDNFILSSPKNSALKLVNYNKRTSEQIFEPGDSADSLDLEDYNNNNHKKYNKRQCEPSSDSVHKSVIYISGTLNNNNKINNTENIDDSTTLASSEAVEESNVINVIFKNSFNNAQQIINDVNCPGIGTCCDYIESDDDFPMGMEADFLNRLQYKFSRQRYLFFT